jgi:23S rRNA (guanosine2251-2'-O)-methyltransferase
MKKREVSILLHDIRSVHNVGAIFRTADAVGVSKIYLSGYTPAPFDRFGSPRSDFAKCALGSEKSVAWEQVASPSSLISRLKREEFSVISIEQDKRSIDYKKARLGSKTLIIFGNEVSGVLKTLLKKSDIIAEIPMKGLKESLNVSVSAGIILYRWFDRA